MPSARRRSSGAKHAVQQVWIIRPSVVEPQPDLRAAQQQHTLRIGPGSPHLYETADPGRSADQAVPVALQGQGAG
jgi:hypothetical protein